MRGDERIQDGIFSYVSLEQQVPADHPLRAVRKLTDAVLGTLSPEFDALYAASGRPSVAPEHTLRALLLQVFYSVRSLLTTIDSSLLAAPRPIRTLDITASRWERWKESNGKTASAFVAPAFSSSRWAMSPASGCRCQKLITRSKPPK